MKFYACYTVSKELQTVICLPVPTGYLDLPMCQLLHFLQDFYLRHFSNSLYAHTISIGVAGYI
jgi:hypothetical protein